jgi:hypothetical protein
MTWVFIGAGVVLLLLLITAGYTFLSDPEEVDHEEMRAVGKETMAARKNVMMREGVNQERESVKEKEDYPSGQIEDFPSTDDLTDDYSS